MKKGKKQVKFAPIFRPVNVQVVVQDSGMNYMGRVLDIIHDGSGNMRIYVRIR